MSEAKQISELESQVNAWRETFKDLCNRFEELSLNYANLLKERNELRTEVADLMEEKHEN